MMSRLVVVTGTSTGIGKTHMADALLREVGAMQRRVVGLKPVETGLSAASVSDAERLERASTFHVKPFGYAYADPVSPHLAARLAGDGDIDFAALTAHIDGIRNEADLVVVELPGGLFTPLSDDCVNADFARDLDPDATLLVAPDRLGVLHDVLAALRAAETVPVTIHGILVVEPTVRDESTSRNAPELSRLLLGPGRPFIHSVRRASVDELVRVSSLRDVAAYVAG